MGTESVLCPTGLLSVGRQAKILPIAGRARHNPDNDREGAEMPSKNRSQAELVNVLKTILLFGPCSKVDLRRIAAIVKQVEFAAGEVICREGDTGVGLHVVLEGETKVQIGGRTRRKLGAGAFFGEIALLDGGPRSATVVAETPVRTLSIPAWNFKTTLRSNPSLALKMLEEACRRLRTSSTDFSN